MNAHSQPGELKRGLKNRHIQLIALGGAVGTGLFLGSAGVMKSAGPSMILGYAIGGFIAFLIMRQLGRPARLYVRLELLDSLCLGRHVRAHRSR